MKIALTIFAILALFISPFVLIIHWIGKADDEQRQHYEQREREWMQFSMQHHCSVVKESTFLDAATTWQCDGNFQVRRFPNN